MHRAVSVERGYFLPLIGTAAGLGRCRLCPDKDAVCGPLLGACVASRVLTHHWKDREGGREGGSVFRGYIYRLVTPSLNQQTWGYPRVVLWAIYWVQWWLSPSFPSLSIPSITSHFSFFSYTLKALNWLVIFLSCLNLKRKVVHAYVCDD